MTIQLLYGQLSGRYIKQIREEKRKRAMGEKKRKDSPLRVRLEKSFVKLKNSSVLDSPDLFNKEKIEQIEQLIKELLKGEGAT